MNHSKRKVFVKGLKLLIAIGFIPAMIWALWPMKQISAITSYPVFLEYYDKGMFKEEKSRADFMYEALCAGVAWGKTDMIEYLLLNESIDIDKPREKCAVETAIRKGEKESLILLLDHGFAPEGVKDPIGKQALKVAIQEGKYELLGTLMEYGALMTEKLAMELIKKNHPDAANYVLDHLDIKLLDYMVAEAVSLRAHHIINYILKQTRFDVNLQNLVQRAMDANALEILDACLKKGVDVNEFRGPSDKTMLGYAASEGLIRVVKYLLTKNAQVDAQDITSRTALHYAIIKDRNFIVTKTLFLAGANQHIQTSEGLSAVDYAKAKEDRVTMALFEE